MKLELKIIIEEPNGSRKTFKYNVKDKKQGKEIVKEVKASLKPGFNIVYEKVSEVR